MKENLNACERDSLFIDAEHYSLKNEKRLATTSFCKKLKRKALEINEEHGGKKARLLSAANYENPGSCNFSAFTQAPISSPKGEKFHRLTKTLTSSYHSSSLWKNVVRSEHGKFCQKQLSLITRRRNNFRS